MKTKKTSNYLGCKTPDDESTREQAIAWKNTLDIDTQIDLCIKYNDVCKLHGRLMSKLTGREIEEIYNKEVLEPKRQKEWQESQVNRRYSKPNQKQINSTYCSNKNCVGGVITFDGQTGRLCKKCNPVNTKQFKQFDESLFKAYISKFSDEDKLKMWDWLTSELSNTVVKTRFEKMLKQLY